MAVSLAVTLVVQEMDANSTRRVWGALDSFRSQVERVSDGDFVDIAPFQLSEEVLRIQSSYRRICPVSRYGLSPILRSRSAKRGSLRIESHTGSPL